jgi:hypothetical protein
MKIKYFSIPIILTSFFNTAHGTDNGPINNRLSDENKSELWQIQNQSTSNEVSVNEIQRYNSLMKGKRGLQYEKITWRIVDGNIQYTDAWNERSTA